MGMSSGMGGGDPAMAAKRKLPYWMQAMGTPGPVPFQPQQIPGGQQTPGMPMGLLGSGGGAPQGPPGGGYATSQLFGGGDSGGAPSGMAAMLGAGGGGPGAGLPSQLGASGGGPATASLYGAPQGSSGGDYATSQLYGGSGGAPSGGYATSQMGQFNPASRDFGAYLQSLMRRGRRGGVR